jgi:amino acid transporter
MTAFGISDRLATILSFPALYGTTALFIYGYCKQFKALSRSKLIPAAFSWTFPHSNIPYFNLIFMTTLNYLLLVIIHVALIRQQVMSFLFVLFCFVYFSLLSVASFSFASTFLLVVCSFFCFSYPLVVAVTIFYITLLGTFCTYFTMFVSFITFRRKFSSLPRFFVNPFGMIDAVVGMVILFLSFVGLAASFYWNFPYFMIYLLFLSLYYYCFARKAQIVSEEEQSIMLPKVR